MAAGEREACDRDGAGGRHLDRIMPLEPLSLIAGLQRFAGGLGAWLAIGRPAGGHGSRSVVVIRVGGVLRFERRGFFLSNPCVPGPPFLLPCFCLSALL